MIKLVKKLTPVLAGLVVFGQLSQIHAEPRQYSLRIAQSDLSPDTPLDEQDENSEPNGSKESAQTRGMNLSKMTAIIEDIGESVEIAQNGSTIAFTYDNAQLIAVVSEPANRMRLISPVMPASEMTESQMAASLVSNYHLALDARYAVGDGVLYTVYIHPLNELTADQLRSAIRQVATLRNTFGTSYSSGEMTFGVETQDKIEL